MSGETMFLYLIAAASLIFSAYNGFCYILKQNKTAQTTGTIISITSPNPETAKARNSKWAKVSYKVNDRKYTSQNRVQVPMTAQVGSLVKVRYDMKQPERLYSFSLMRSVVGFCISAICVVTAVFGMI